jgi:hypothetical protein
MNLTQTIFTNLSPLTVVPNPVKDTEQFLQWANRFYEEAAFCLNARVIPFYKIQITSTATDIPNLPTFGSFVICVSGVASDQPSAVWGLAKSTDDQAGQVFQVVASAGTGDWAGNLLFVTSTATNFQIRHNRAGVTEVFNISVFGTQIGTQ